MWQISINIEKAIPRFIFTVIFSAALASLNVFGQVENGSDARPLTVGQTSERELKGGEAHSYVLVLQAGQFLNVVVEQKGIDAVVALFDSENKKLLEVDNPNGIQGAEPLSFIAENAGNYRLEIRSPGKNAAGRYEVKIKEMRMATEKDKNRIAAQQARSEGVLLYLQGKAESLQDATTKYGEALRLYRSVEDRGGEATMLNYTGMIRSRLNENEKAIEYFNQALLLYKATADKFEESRMFFNIGLLFARLNENRKAIDSFNQALLLYRAMENKSEEARTLTRIGVIHARLDENRKALDYFNQALTLYQSLGIKAEEARTFISLGNAHTRLGEYKKAIDFYLQGLQLVKVIGDNRVEATTLQNIASLYADLGELQKSLNHYQESLSLLGDGAEEKRVKAHILNNIGTVYTDMKDHQKALEYYLQALPLVKTVNDRRNEAGTLNNIGRAYYNLGENQKALENLNQALTLHKAVEDKSSEAVAIKNLALVYSKTKENQKALENFNQALTLHRVVSDRRNEANTLNHLSDFWESLDNSNLAILYGKQSVNKYQELRREIKELDREIQIAYLKTVEPVYRKLAVILITEGRITEAEEVLAMLKEEEVFDYLRRDDEIAKELLQTIPLTNKEREVLKRYDEIADRITKIGKQFGELDIERKNYNPNEPFPKQALYNELKKQLDDANIVFQKFLEQLKIKFTQTDERVASVDSSLQSTLAMLGEKRVAIVSTIVSEEKLYIIVTTANTQRAYGIGIGEKDVNKLVAEFRQALTDPEIDPRPAGQKLYDILVKPIRGALEGIKAQTILWSLDGTLRYLPPAALWDKQQGYLAENYASAVLTLASRDKLALNVSDTQVWSALGVGVSKPTEGFTALTAVPDELDCIITDPQTSVVSSSPKCQKGVFTGKKLLDDKFTLTAFEDALGRYSVVHIASHFRLNPGNADDSFLLLGGGEQRRFTLEKLRSFSLTGVELIVLSACNTATPGGARANGVEIESFGTIAQKRGAKSVMATLWSVADTSTKDLVVEFYQIYDEEQGSTTKAQALQKAQLKMMRGSYTKNEVISRRASEIFKLDDKGKTLPAFKKDEKAPFAHPYFWSPFILIGNWR